MKVNDKIIPSLEEQKKIISEVEKDFLKFWDKDFDASVIAKCRDNFSLTKDIQSVQILKQNLSKKPRFSIVIPTYKRLDELRRALKTALEQDIDEEYEILIVENTDHFEETSAQKMLENEFFKKVNYYKNQSNLELFGNWNRCILLAQGKWVCLLQSDDILMSDYLSEMRKIIENEKYSNAALIACVDNPKDVFPPRNDNRFKDKISYLFKKIFLSKDCIEKISMKPKSWRKEALDNELIGLPPNAVLHNKDKILDIGGYNQDEYPSGDMAFFNRVNAKYEVFLYRKKILQHKTTEVATSSTPKCKLQFIFLDPIVFSAFVKEKNRLKIMQYKQIRNWKRDLKKQKCFEICSYVDIFLKKHNIV